MKFNSIIRTAKPLKSISIQAKPTKLIPLKPTNSLIKHSFNNNKPMLNSIKSFLPNPTTIFDYLPNKWTLAWYLANSFINKSKNRPIDFSLLNQSQENVRTNNSSTIQPNQEPDNTCSSNHCSELGDKPPVSTNHASKPSYYISGKYAITPNQRPALKVKLQVNKANQRTKFKPLKRFKNKLNHSFHTLANSKLFTVNNLLIGAGFLWLTLLTILILKLSNQTKFRKK